MSARNDGGPAFPVPFYFDPTRGECGRFVDGLEVGAPTGITVRDFFAAQALTVLVQSKLYRDERFTRDEAFNLLALDAYAQADAMLAAREAQS